MQCYFHWSCCLVLVFKVQIKNPVESVKYFLLGSGDFYLFIYFNLHILILMLLLGLKSKPLHLHFKNI